MDRQTKGRRAKREGKNFSGIVARTGGPRYRLAEQHAERYFGRTAVSDCEPLHSTVPIRNYFSKALSFTQDHRLGSVCFPCSAANAMLVYLVHIPFPLSAEKQKRSWKPPFVLVELTCSSSEWCTRTLSRS